MPPNAEKRPETSGKMADEYESEVFGRHILSPIDRVCVLIIRLKLPSFLHCKFTEKDWDAFRGSDSLESLPFLPRLTVTERFRSDKLFCHFFLDVQDDLWLIHDDDILKVQW